MTGPRSRLADRESLQGIAANAQGDSTTGQSFVVDINQGPELGQGQEIEAVRKKKKKSKGGKKKKAASGFEENFADTPLTPEEHKEEAEDLYHPSRSFAERIEFCIQRYRARRKFDSERKDMFDKYLILGGIESGPKAFSGGIDPNSTADRDAAEIATLAATDYVGGDKVTAGTASSDWAIDFEGIVKCFFSSRVPQTYDLDIDRNIPLCTGVVKNFLNYVLYHNVCPEYFEQVHSAKAVCELAFTELNFIKVLGHQMPGDFNVACSTLYGGYYQGIYTGEQEWAQGLELHSGMDDTRAKQVVMTAISAYGTDEQFEQAQGEIKIIRTEDLLGLEATEIMLADSKTRDFYEKSLGGAVKILGKLKAKRWAHPFSPEEDISEDEAEAETGEDQRAALQRAEEEEVLEFWVEEEILENCFVGMKIIVSVKTLNCGIKYFDTVMSLFCSFLTTLDQETMIGWKKPEKLEPRGGGEVYVQGENEHDLSD